MGSDSPYATDTGGSQAPSADSGAVQTADRSDASPTDTPPAAPDGGAGGGEAFDNPAADTGQQETTSEAGPDTPQQAAPAPDGGAGGGEAFDNPDSEATSPPPDSEQQDQRQEVTTDDQPTEIPERANQVADYARTHNDSPPPGYKGNRVYENDNHALPEGGDYREYDIDPRVQGTPRNAERIVIDRNTGESWYTPDHYTTFHKMG